MGDPTDEFVSVRELPRVVEARRLDEQRGIETREGRSSVTPVTY